MVTIQLQKMCDAGAWVDIIATDHNFVVNVGSVPLLTIGSASRQNANETISIVSLAYPNVTDFIGKQFSWLAEGMGLSHQPC